MELKMKISKELVSEVLGVRDITDEVILINRNVIYKYHYKLSGQQSKAINTINIYEFINECKKWLFNKHGYGVRSLYNGGCGDCVTLEKTDCKDGTNDFFKDFEAKTEIEAILKACEWILEQIK